MYYSRFRQNDLLIVIISWQSLASKSIFEMMNILTIFYDHILKY